VRNILGHSTGEKKYFSFISLALYSGERYRAAEAAVIKEKESLE
jgi:hypothetical protein